MNQAHSLRSDLARGRGWVVILRGLMAVAFGVLAIAWTGMNLPKLVVLFGIYALAHGLLSIAAAIGSREQRVSALLLAEGIVGLFAGIMTLQSASPSAKALVFLIWLWAISTGVLRVIEAIQLRKQITGDIWLLLSGIVPVIFGGMLILRPIIGPVGLALMIAISALLWGAFEVILGCELRAIRHHGQPVVRT